MQRIRLIPVQTRQAVRRFIFKRKRTKVQEYFERADARPEGWSTGCAE